MSLAGLWYALRWLIRDTFRQALASQIFWIMLALSALSILVCLSVNVVGDQPPAAPGEPSFFLPGQDPAANRQAAQRTGVDIVSGEMTFAFGAFRVELFRSREAAVHFLHVILGKWVAGTVGLLLALVWTASFVPSFLEPTAATVLLAKPVPRWCLVIGKYVGVLVFVAFQMAIFIGGTWAALGLRTGVWTPNYLLSLPFLLLQFMIIYGFSVLVGVYTRSTIASITGSSPNRRTSPFSSTRLCTRPSITLYYRNSS
jgi:ABC-type transport system involved in multi-copper enzyme maturation permease subunit